MASKYQTRPFPKEKLGTMSSHVVIKNENVYELPHRELELIIQNGQLCWYHRVTDTLMPIARQSTIQKLFIRGEENG